MVRSGESAQCSLCESGLNESTQQMKTYEVRVIDRTGKSTSYEISGAASTRDAIWHAVQAHDARVCAAIAFKISRSSADEP